MAIRNFRPTTPSRRGTTMVSGADLTTEKPHKPLVKVKHSTGGRNSSGRITTRFRGGGNKRRYRVIDFKRNKDGVPAKVATIEYDPNRSARIALLHYADGEKRYMLAPNGIKVGATVMSGPEAEPEIGNCLPIGKIPLGLMVHNIELQRGRGGQLCRGAGNSAQLMARDGQYATLRLPSGEIRLVHIANCATIGQVSNPDHANVKLGKAGKKRWLGRRPHVRGVAMNPVDHPMGGGEGRSSGGGHPVSPWGWQTKGKKTRKRSKPSNKFIVKRRK
ncbi:MAG: 50S ribosomal protein L2 [Verrucomicrobiota bacterium]|jgi:large subunit ribosomal protein L2|nr:50S ribosomal protein L2 [Verrucomicrobiota bacterium]MDD8044849.1 50S ribosomal protein L2 [Verrucomicrobiota bacterium]MDD8049729.1 50S ribosomal protein L2 [Verrucomicrobiota bacterium]HCF95321.1 50S ribosomal protein L2 [Verrucomicrobiota bacterium]